MGRLATAFLYVEGDPILKNSFQEFFQEERQALLRRFRFQVVMGGSNALTARKWRRKRELAQRTDDRVFLLLDSEGPVDESDARVPAGCSTFLESADMETGDVFFMVQLMESWFLTHWEELARLYGQGFRTESPAIPSAKMPSRAGEALEAVAKQKVLETLSAATRGTKKGAYDRTNAKTTIAPAMLEVMCPARIADVSYHMRRLRQQLEAL